MPPDGDTTVTISDELAAKLARIMERHDCSSYPEAIACAADTTLLRDDITGPGTHSLSFEC